MNGISTPPAAAERQFENVAAAEIVHGRHLADRGAGLVAHGEADQVGVVELALLDVVRQRRAVDEELGAGQRLGRVAVGDALEADDDDLLGRPDGGDLEGAAVPVEQRPVVAERHRVAGERLDAQFALDAVGGADDGHLDGIAELGHDGCVAFAFTGC